MTKWLDRMINWGHIVIPLFIALLVLLLGRIGCSETYTQKVESVKQTHEVTSSLKNTNQQILLR